MADATWWEVDWIEAVTSEHPGRERKANSPNHDAARWGETKKLMLQVKVL